MKYAVSILLTAHLLLSAFQGVGQNNNTADSLETVKRLMRQNGSVESLYIGAFAKPSKQCLRFLFIAKLLNVNDLELLTSDKSPCLRIYAYSYLRQVYNINKRKAKQEMLKDTSVISFMNGCLGGKVQVRYVLKRIKEWGLSGTYENWMKQYNEMESRWIDYLMSE